MGVDIKQLAAGLGVSASTVSRALNGYTDIKAETRERIVKRANELNYHPNLRAQRLAKGRADAVGIVYPFDNGYVGNPKFLEMISAFSARLESSGIDLLLAAAGDASEMATYGRLVRGGRVDAILLADTKVVDSRIDFLQQAGLPFLCYGRSGARNDFAWYDFDNEAGSRLAVERLAALGHKRIAYIHTSLAFNYAAQRHTGFITTMKRLGLPVHQDAIVIAGRDRRSGFIAVEKLLKLSQRPTAILVDNSVGGVGVIHALLEAGLVLGRDVSVVVDGGNPTDTLLHQIDVAVVMQPTPRDSGRRMAEMLLQLIEGNVPVEGKHVLMQPQFVDGKTIGPVRI
jgi:LacI family transcriptional regulator